MKEPIQIKFLLIAFTDIDTNGQYTSGPTRYNRVLGFETREQAEKELEDNKDNYTKCRERYTCHAEIVELDKPITNYDILYNGWIYRNRMREE